MAAGAMATAAGAAVMVYLILRGRKNEKDKWWRRRRYRVKVGEAPRNLVESMATLSETLRFTYSESLGKWSIADLAFGINHLLRKQGNLAVGSVYGGSGCMKLKGALVVAELRQLLMLLTFCMLFSKKPFHQFLDEAGFSTEHVLHHNPNAELLKPAFTIIRDTQSKCFLLLIRGTHSIKDTLTAATGAVVPFHHSVLKDGEISNLVLGYAHCGMVAAARWIAKLCTSTLVKALAEYPDFKVKIVGHSLGGGTGALLTYILREQKELSSSTCVAFAPAACMTLELAESGKHFITTIINNSDLVPTLSASSVDDLRSEVAASSWLNDLWDQIEHTKVLNVVYRSATTFGSRFQSLYRANDIGPLVNYKLENLAEASHVPMLNKDEANSSGGGHVHDAIDEDITTSAVDNITEGELWYELEKELHTQNLHAHVEEVVAAMEIIEEENQLIDAAEGSNDPITICDDVNSYRFYPPGKIMHIVSDESSSNSIEERVNLYETPRQLYSKLRLSRTMIKDHYMRMYKKMIQLLIQELEKDDNVK